MYFYLAMVGLEPTPTSIYIHIHAQNRSEKIRVATNTIVKVQRSFLSPLQCCSPVRCGPCVDPRNYIELIPV